MKQKIPRGMLLAKIIPVVRVPSSGSPEDNSKIEPTAAIAAMQEPANKAPLLGVTDELLPYVYIKFLKE